jgi:MFS family permease
MSIDDSARWLSRVTLAVSIIMIGWGLSVVLSPPVTAWFAASATIWMALLLICAFGSYVAPSRPSRRWRWPPPWFRACSAFCV